MCLFALLLISMASLLCASLQAHKRHMLVNCQSLDMGKTHQVLPAGYLMLDQVLTATACSYFKQVTVQNNEQSIQYEHLFLFMDLNIFTSGSVQGASYVLPYCSPNIATLSYLVHCRH